jgi:presequence protease
VTSRPHTEGKEIASFVFSQKSLRVAITCGKEIQSDNLTSVTNLLGTLPSFDIPAKSTILPIGSLPSQAFFTLPYSVNYAALSLKGVPYTHPDSPVLRVLANLIEQKRIHPEIREKGGAYGGGARYSSLDGIFSFISYRDPSFERSLGVMRDSGRWTTEQTFTDESLGEMKLSIFKDVDAPISVQEEGMQEFMYGLTDNMRQTYLKFSGIANK